jgi:hypothetical protein
VSFVFGLEVNWCLLKSSEEEKREERELRKAQAQRDLEELNESRRKKKRDLSSTDTVDYSEAADCTKEQLPANPDKEKENKINNSDGGKSKKKLKSEAGPHDSSQEVRRKDKQISKPVLENKKKPLIDSADDDDSSISADKFDSMDDSEVVFDDSAKSASTIQAKDCAKDSQKAPLCSLSSLSNVSPAEPRTATGANLKDKRRKLQVIDDSDEEDEPNSNVVPKIASARISSGDDVAIGAPAGWTDSTVEDEDQLEEASDSLSRKKHETRNKDKNKSVSTEMNTQKSCGEPPLDSKWSCGCCTYINGPRTSQCGMCGVKRSKSAKLK